MRNHIDYITINKGFRNSRFQLLGDGIAVPCSYCGYTENETENAEPEDIWRQARSSIA